jgi:hypothetical protein
MAVPTLSISFTDNDHARQVMCWIE